MTCSPTGPRWKKIARLQGKQWADRRLPGPDLWGLIMPSLGKGQNKGKQQQSGKKWIVRIISHFYGTLIKYAFLRYMDKDSPGGILKRETVVYHPDIYNKKPAFQTGFTEFELCGCLPG